MPRQIHRRVSTSHRPLVASRSLRTAHPLDRDRTPGVVQDAIAALPDLALAATFLITWFAPQTFGTGKVKVLLLVMLLEFLVVHSAGFMGVVAVSDMSKGRKTGAILGLALFYTLFAAAFSLGFSSWWPLLAFWGLILNRLLGVLVGQPPDGREKAFIMTGWGVGAAVYLLGVFATTFPPLPRLGMTERLVRSLELPGSGLWVDEPHRVLAFGALYFTLIGVWSYAGRRWMARGTTPS
jgi:hypothetical protein